MHMRQMQILLSGGKSAADMALGLVDIENVTRFCGKLRVYAKQPVSIRDILVHSGFADAKLLCVLSSVLFSAEFTDSVTFSSVCDSVSLLPLLPHPVKIPSTSTAANTNAIYFFILLYCLTDY